MRARHWSFAREVAPISAWTLSNPDGQEAKVVSGFPCINSRRVGMPPRKGIYFRIGWLLASTRLTEPHDNVRHTRASSESAGPPHAERVGECERLTTPCSYCHCVHLFRHTDLLDCFLHLGVILCRRSYIRGTLYIHI